MSFGREEDPLATALREGPIGTALRLSRRARGLSLDALVSRLAKRGIFVSRSTLSAWEHGRHRPERLESVAALRVLEREYGYEPETLTRLVGPARPRGRHANVDPDLPPAYERLLAEAGGRSPVRTIALHDLHSVDADGTAGRHRTRHVVAATHPGTDRLLAVIDTDGQAGVPDVRGVLNCRAGPTWQDTETGLVAVDLRFDRVLDEGQTQLVEYELEMDFPVPRPTHYRRLVPAGVEHLVVHVEFHDVPARVVWCRWPAAGSIPHELHELSVGDARTSHEVVSEPTPGDFLGIRWQW